MGDMVWWAGKAQLATTCCFKQLLLPLRSPFEMANVAAVAVSNNCFKQLLLLFQTTVAVVAVGDGENNSNTAKANEPSLSPQSMTTSNNHKQTTATTVIIKHATGNSNHNHNHPTIQPYDHHQQPTNIKQYNKPNHQ